MIVYYPDKLTINNETLFIVTTYFKEPHQKYLLDTCVNRIKIFHPDSDILILNDTEVQERIGEINAYLWAAEHIYSYKNFIFIHDSVFLINRLPIPENPFSPLWYSSEDMKDNTHGEEIEVFLKKFHINNAQIYDQVNLLRNNEGSLVFGSMAVFNSEFLYFLKNNTNFLDLAHMFNSRHMRSFFERVLYIIANEFYKTNTKQYSICGNIFNHKRVFKTACSLDSLSAGNPYALKVWQGR
jgi:hypothetical protein